MSIGEPSTVLEPRVLWGGETGSLAVQPNRFSLGDVDNGRRRSSDNVRPGTATAVEQTSRSAKKKQFCLETADALSKDILFTWTRWFPERRMPRNGMTHDCWGWHGTLGAGYFRRSVGVQSGFHLLKRSTRILVRFLYCYANF